MKVYLTFINNHFPPNWDRLAVDLQRCVPYAFAHNRLEISLKPFYSADRQQYYSTQILAELLKNKPPDGAKILGITNVDIFVPILTFLFGEAQLNGPGALISTFRLRNEFYGLPADNALLYDRTLKEALHELGHTMGLVHCQNFECVMFSSTYVEDSDIKQAQFCPACQNILGINCR